MRPVKYKPMSDLSKEKLVSTRRRRRLAMSVYSLVTEQEDDLCQVQHFKLWAIARLEEVGDIESNLFARVDKLERSVASLLQQMKEPQKTEARGVASPVTPAVTSTLAPAWSGSHSVRHSAAISGTDSAGDDAIHSTTSPSKVHSGPDRDGRCTFPSNPDILALTFAETETPSPGPLSDADTQPPTPPFIA